MTRPLSAVRRLCLACRKPLKASNHSGYCYTCAKHCTICHRVRRPDGPHTCPECAAVVRDMEAAHAEGEVGEQGRIRVYRMSEIHDRRG